MTINPRFTVRESEEGLSDLDRAIKELGYTSRSHWYMEMKRQTINQIKKESVKMKKAILRHDDNKGFILFDPQEGNFIMNVDAGTNKNEPDWDLIEKQANKIGYTLD